jgi:glycosyltransferase involved in cell wall biosynthesis
LPEVIQDRKSGILVPPGDVNAFTLAAAELITNASLRTALGEGARLRAKEFDAKRMIQHTAEVYDRVIAG